ncbi:MAG: CBS domain-containing protein [Spirochaetales bacterium]|nr:CBS domain-containing protein [Spirochaetales bacterium]
MNLGELLKKKGTAVETISADDKIGDALLKLNEKHIGALMVVDANGRVEGIISERDLLMICSDCAKDQKVSEFMTGKDKLLSLGLKDSLQKAMQIFTEKRIRHLPILEGEKLVGIISIGDAVKALLDAVELENKYLKEYIMGQDI